MARYDGMGLLWLTRGCPMKAFGDFQDNWNISYMKALKDFQDNWNTSYMKAVNDFQSKHTKS